MDRLAWHARNSPKIESSDGSRTAGKSKVELFVIIELHLDVAAVLDPPLESPIFQDRTEP